MTTGRRGAGRRGSRARRAFRTCALGLFAAWAWLCQRRAALAEMRPADVPATRPQPSRIEVPAGPLAAALDGWREATRLPLSLDVPVEVVESLTSPGCSGRLSPGEALDAILDGTGLVGEVTPRGARVALAYTESVAVESPAPSPLATSLPEYGGDARLAPQSISVVGSETMEAQQATSLQDALRNVAGISLAAGEGGFQGDALAIRGFNARGDLHLDGMRDFASYYRDPFATEQVQVLKGPSGLAFGRGSTGGAVNQATKLPGRERTGSLQAELGTDGTRRLTVDANEPIGAERRGIAVRVAAVAHESDVAGRDVTGSTRLGLAPSISVGLGTSTRWTFSHVHQDADDVPDYGVPWRFDAPADVPRGSYYGFRDASRLETDVDVSTFRFEHDFGPRLQLRNQVRHAESTRFALITSPRLPSSATPSTPLADIRVNRQQVDARSEETLLQEQLDLMASARTGRVEHSIVGGLELVRETSSPTRRAWTGVPTTPLLDPDPSDPFAGTSTVSSDVDVEASTIGLSIVDTMRFTKRFSVVTGLRHDRFDVDHEVKAPAPATLHRVDEATTWRAGVVFEPTPRGSVYASAATSFNPSAESLALSAANEDVKPERNRSFEVGTKWSLRNGKLSLAGAAFLVEKTDARESDPLDPSRQVLSGSQRARGAEIELTGEVRENWSLSAGYAWLDAEITKSKANPALVGEPLANAPRHAFTAWSTHRLGKLELGWGARHVGSRVASSTAPRDPATGRLREAPAYWTADLMMSRPLADGWKLQINVQNVTDELYFDQVHGGHVVPGAGRSATLGVTWSWPRAEHD